MSQNNGNNGNNNNNGASDAPAPSKFGTKVGYVGTGILIGLVIYPFVRKALTKVQPKMDKIFDDLTGKAENWAEKTSDILARAKESLKKSEMSESAHRHDHDETQPNGTIQ